MLVACTMCSLASCGGDDEPEIIIPEEQIIDYAGKIIGYWQLQGAREYWRFDADGSGTKIDPSYGENWDEAEDIFEGEETSNYFQWYFEQNGLMLVYRNNGDYNTPEPDAPFIINSITDTNMTWTTNGGKGMTQKFVRVNRNRQ